MYGVLRDINASRILHRTKIPNLFLTGQNINTHGIMGVIIGACITCSEFLGQDFILKQIMESRA
jgi:all-trans-retinol 13,14-reductase